MMWNGFFIFHVEDSIFLNFTNAKKIQSLVNESNFNPHMPAS